MHTRFSGRDSPLEFDPKIEKTARINRTLPRLDRIVTPGPRNTNQTGESSNQSVPMADQNNQNPPPPPIPPFNQMAQNPLFNNPNHGVNPGNNLHEEDHISGGGSNSGEHGSWHEELHEEEDNINYPPHGEYNDENWQPQGSPNHPVHNNYGHGGWNGQGGWNRQPPMNYNGRWGYNNPGHGWHHRAPVQGVDSHFRPTVTQNPSPIVPPLLRGRSFEIRPQYLAIIPNFRGTATEEPYVHISEFGAICSTIGGQGFTPDEVKLNLFQFSLKERAKQWFHTLPSGSIYTWEEMQQFFLDEYYPMSKTSEARNAIKTFQQQSGELLHEAFTRFKELLRFCPHHQIPKWELIKAFYDGLTPEDLKFVSSSSNGTFLTNSEDDDWELLERLSKGSKTQASASRKAKHVIGKPGGEYVTKERFEALERQIANFNRISSKNNSNVSNVYDVCNFCGDIGHLESECMMNMNRNEEVNQVQGSFQNEKRNNDMNSNTYHPGLHNHPIFRYGNSSNQLNPNLQGSNQQGGNQGPSYQNRQQSYNQGNYQKGNYNKGGQGGGQGGYNQGQSRNFQQSQGSQNQFQGDQQGNNISMEDIANQINELRLMLTGVVQKQELQQKTSESHAKQLGQLAEQLATRDKEAMSPKASISLKKPSKFVKHSYENGEFVKKKTRKLRWKAKGMKL
ncbi:hypothetical protein E3N88_40501 [Mikania micrantha]|uniref:Retrotransposon gag domain-containing protein n=1 Tax=Mikania micrantha TaxID=192012 RepID=A0A5N6LMX5_9ASTR|nr:hypothetical protein E3N88_40501 [Mikania micrantha]